MGSSPSPVRARVTNYGTTSGEHKASQVAQHEERDAYSDSSSESEQAGVKGITAVSRVWTPWSLVIAYTGLFLVAFCSSMEAQTTLQLKTVATSVFGAMGLLATVTLLQTVILAVVKPPMAKIADVFGRLEAFTISILIYVIGYIQMAAADNVKTFASAQIFYAAGSTGLQILQQVFIADTSTLLNRALLSALPDTPFLVTTWIGPQIAGNFTPPANWRWGFGLWAIVLPVAFLPLAVSLGVNARRAAKAGILPESPFKGQSAAAVLKHLWFDIDAFGLILLCAAVCLILLPCTLAELARGGWRNPSMIAMVVVGAVCLVVFPFWERSKRLAPKAFFPRELFQRRTVLAGVSIAFFYYMAFYLSIQPYFLSYLLVVKNLTITSGGYVTETFTFSSTVTAVAVGILIKYTRHYKYFITAGACIYLLGIGLMLHYRQPTTPLATIVGCQIVIGIGGGLINVPTQLGVQASATHQEVAAATAVFLTILEVGGAVGNAISGAVWTGKITPKLEAYLPPDVRGEAAYIAGSYLYAIKYDKGTPAREAIDRAYQETMNILLIIAVCVCVPLIPLSLCMKNYRLEGVRSKVEGRGRRDSDDDDDDDDGAVVVDGSAGERRS